MGEEEEEEEGDLSPLQGEGLMRRASRKVSMRAGSLRSNGSMRTPMTARTPTKKRMTRKEAFGRYNTDNRTAAQLRTFVQSAVSLQFLTDFLDRCQESSPDVTSMSTEQVLQQFVITPTAQRRCAYLDSGLVLAEDVGEPTLVVIHR